MVAPPQLVDAVTVLALLDQQPAPMPAAVNGDLAVVRVPPMVDYPPMVWQWILVYVDMRADHSGVYTNRDI